MKKNFDLNRYLGSAQVQPIHISKTHALVDIGCEKLKCIAAPKDTKLTLHFALIAYLNSQSLKKLSTNSRRAAVRNSCKFFEFLAYSKYHDDTDVPLNVLEEYTQYLRKKYPKLTANSIKDLVYSIKNHLEKFQSEEDHSENEHAKTLCFIYNLNCPTFQIKQKKPNPTLASLFPDCPFTDTEIIKSLRLICCWILLSFERHREILLRVPEVLELVGKLRLRDLTKPPILYGTLHSRDESLNKESKRIYFPLMKAVKNSGNYELMERALLDINHPYDSALTSDQIDTIFSQFINNIDGSFRRHLILEKKRFTPSTFQSLSLRDFIAPSSIEVFSMRCLLASERIQASNLSRLKITDVSENDKGIQIQHFKNRRPKGDKMGVTAIYPKRKLIGAVKKTYINFLTNAQPYLDNTLKGHFLPFPRAGIVHGTLGMNMSVLTKYFKLLLRSSSYAQTALFKDVGKEECKPFLWVVQALINCNDEVGKQEKNYRKQLKFLKKNRTINRIDYVTKSKISLSPALIGRSRVAMDSVNTVWVKGQTDPQTLSDPMVKSQLTAHSESTKHNIYHDRSNSKEKIESDRTFAVQLGELMTVDAQKMGELLRRSNVVDYVEAKRLLGCMSASEKLEDLISELGAEVGLMDEIMTASKTIFVATETTAALIIKRISHLKKQIPVLLNDDPITRTKALKAAEELVYYQHILERFPEDIQKSGEMYSKKLNFSYASLL